VESGKTTTEGKNTKSSVISEAAAVRESASERTRSWPRTEIKKRISEELGWAYIWKKHLKTVKLKTVQIKAKSMISMDSDEDKSQKTH
jgi:hypothetical protein